MTFGSGPGRRRYATALSELRDYRRLLPGHLLVLHDVTEQRQAQAQMLEQRWAQATLLEREQLAYELHDGLSQSLAFLNVQAQAAKLYLDSGRVEAARASLSRLAEVSRGLQGDVRELIGNLLAVSLPSEGLCATLRQIAAQFERQNGIAGSLEVDDPAGALSDPSLLSAAAAVQLVRIAQEALANVRKHGAGADRIRVELRAGAGQVRLSVIDNGAGFDRGGPGPEGQHFGLQVMRQRAERIGGRLTVHSAPGQGTHVAVTVPLTEREGEGG
jgi:signal transduction histidine kinase